MDPLLLRRYNREGTRLGNAWSAPAFFRDFIRHASHRLAARVASCKAGHLDRTADGTMSPSASGTQQGSSVGPATRRGCGDGYEGGTGLDRSEIRNLKRATRTCASPDTSEQARDRGRAAALALLDHSIKNRHKRLALIRLEVAIRLGGRVTPNHWRYCEDVVRRSGDSSLRELVLRPISAGEGRNADAHVGENTQSLVDRDS